MKKRWWQSVWLALGWLVLVSVGFCLPGSTLPKENWLSDIHFDKWVHIGFFALLLLLWSAALQLKRGWVILGMALLYGLLVEWVQKNYIANRGFDLYDVAADMVGATIGWFVWLRVKQQMDKGEKK